MHFCARITLTPPSTRSPRTIAARPEAAVEGLATAVGATCRSEVQSLIDEKRASGEFAQIDWFGSQGHTLGTAIITSLESRLAALSDKKGSP